MRFITTNSTGTAITTSQAPWVNLVISTTTSTTAVASAPTALTDSSPINVPLQPCSAACLRQCTTMPAWLSVNDTNTPRMYS